MDFAFEKIKETEKAIFAKVPYWEATGEDKKKHKQLYYECWIPKSIIAAGAAKDFVIKNRNEARVKNAYQKHFHKMPVSWNTMGELAPEKIKEVVEQIDSKKLAELRSNLMGKYGATSYDRDLINSPLPNVSEEDSDLAIVYRSPVFPEQYAEKMKDDRIPKIKVTYYRTIDKKQASV